MVRRPDSSSFSPSISEGFDDSKNYRVKLLQVEERESQFTDAKRSQIALVWHLAIYDEDGVAFTDTNTGEIFDLWAWTSDSTFANPTTGQRSKARQYTEAFIGRELSDEDVNELIDQGFAQVLENKTALGSFEIVTNNDGNARINVVKLRPLKKETPAATAGRSAAAASASAREQLNRSRQPTSASTAPRQQRIDDDIPF
jgi:hypothetical protein